MGIVGRLLILLAVLFMPFGMEPASAAASHGQMAGMSMQHCPDQSGKHQRNDGLAACTMACASALPAQELRRDETMIRLHQLVMPMAEQTLHGIHPEIDTPPPRPA